MLHSKPFRLYVGFTSSLGALLGFCSRTFTIKDDIKIYLAQTRNDKIKNTIGGAIAGPFFPLFGVYFFYTKFHQLLDKQ